jgi:SprT protein
MVDPIGEAQRRQVTERTEHFMCQAEEAFELSFERIPLLFDLRGRTAGMFKVVGRERCIRYNPWIFGKYFEENLRDTVPHEVAHYVVNEIYGGPGTRGWARRRWSVKPHGPEWQAVMACFGADPEVTFKLDLAGVPQRRQRTHPYQCGCREHDVSTTRHNRILRGAGRYHCRYCKGQLVYSG